MGEQVLDGEHTTLKEIRESRRRYKTHKEKKIRHEVYDLTKDGIDRRVSNSSSNYPSKTIKEGVKPFGIQHQEVQ